MAFRDGLMYSGLGWHSVDFVRLLAKDSSGLYHRERTQKELQLWHFKGTTFVAALIKLAVLTLPRDRNIPCVEFRQRGCACPVGLSSHCFVGNTMVIRLYTCTSWIMSAVNVRVVYKRKFSSGKITVFKDLV